MASFTMFPDTKPLPLTPGQTGPLFEFFVKVGAEEMFLRVIALWTDNTALEGAAPTFQLKAPGGIITSVNAGAGDVDLPGEGGLAGTADCQRLQGDIYLVTIADINEDVTGRKWQLRIRNNADQALNFVWVSSDKERDTRQPWMVLGDPPDAPGLAGPARLSLAGASRGEFFTVRNWGTAPLEIRDAVNEPIGGPQSPAILVSRPAQIAPHGVDHMVIRCEPVDVPAEFPHTFDSNDPEPTHKTLRIEVG